MAPEERRLREEVRAFLAENAPSPADLPRSLDARIEALRGWQASCYRAGYVGRAWPRSSSVCTSGADGAGCSFEIA